MGTCEKRTDAQWRLPKKPVSPAETIGIWHCASVLFSQVPNKCTDLDLSLLYILTSGAYNKFARNFCSSAQRLLSAALLERWPQVCHVKIMFTKLPTNRFVSTTTVSMKCVVNWIPLRIGVRLRNTQHHLNREISRNSHHTLCNNPLSARPPCKNGL